MGELTFLAMYVLNSLGVTQQLILTVFDFISVLLMTCKVVDFKKSYSNCISIIIQSVS